MRDELIMSGDYATFVVQGLFRNCLPGAFDWESIAAIPVAFMASALVGAALERSKMQAKGIRELVAI
jgi:urea transport system permease protein